MRLIIIIFCFPAMLYAQGGIVVDGAHFNVEAITEVRVEEAGVTNQNGGQISNMGNIYLDLDWIQTGATTGYNGTGWMWFEGTVDQNISSASVMIVPRLRVDNGQKLVLGSDISVSTEVDLMNHGNIELGTNNLVISSGGLVSNYDNNNYIITNSTGYLQQEVLATNVVFPIGNSTYNPATLNNAGTTDNFQARVGDIVYDAGTTGNVETDDVVNRTWYIEEENIGGSDVTLTLQWEATQELTVFDRTQSAVAHWDGSKWDHAGIYSNAIANGSYWMQSRSGLNSFSPFAVEDITEILPVELLSFEAMRISVGQVELDWVTEGEINNKGFFVERMLANEKEFTEVAWVDGNKTTTITNSYNIIDDNSYSGISYYRLKQVDFDGSVNYSFVRAVEGIAIEANVTLFPNPTDDFINIRFGELTAKNVDVRIFATNGKLIFQKKAAITTNMLLTLEETEALPAGAYMIQLLLDNGTQLTKKFIKSRL